MSITETPNFAQMETQLTAASEELLYQGRQAAFSLAQNTIETNPAYKMHLLQQGFNPSSLISADGLVHVPQIDKSWLTGRPIQELCPDIDQIYTFSRSSGMTGAPLIIPRRKDADAGVYPAVKQMFVDLWEIDRKSTFTLTSWALGTWVAGPLMVKVGDQMAYAYRLNTMHPGANLTENVDLINKLSGQYEQTILQAYPPFAATVIKALINGGTDLTPLNLKLFVAGEPMSENWRILMQKILGGENGERDLTRIVSLYGTAEGGVMAFETKLSILIRKLAHQNPDLAQALFGQTDGVPMFFQYPPQAKWIEAVDGEIVFTGVTGIPSIRYNMHDHGGVITFSDTFKTLHAFGYDPLKTLRELGYPQPPAPLPFVFVHGRSDGGVSIDGGNVYPADMDTVLSDPQVLLAGISEYMLDVKEDETNGTMRLVIHLQLKEGIDQNNIGAETQSEIAYKIAQIIATNNPDYAQSLADNPASATPIINLHDYCDPLFSINRHKLKRTRQTGPARSSS